MPNNWSYKTGLGGLVDTDLAGLIGPFAHKLAWFLDHGYKPHTYQLLFHCLTNEVDNHVARWRHLIAGRRGGKTLSAAWEILYYCQHPEMWHLHRRGIESNKPLHIWVLAKNNKVGRASLLTFREVITEAGLVKDRDYKENRGELYFEFENGTLVEFKTADDPQSLRGMGLDIMWIDEAAFIPSREAWDVCRPALSNKLGGIICTTTPQGKNWYYDEFFVKLASSPDCRYVEYRSLDNPYFPREDWIAQKREYHPMLFKQEYEASFDSMAGRELPGSWLTDHYYDEDDLKKHRNPDTGELMLDYYLGMDLAISLADTADYTVMACIGVSRRDASVFLIDMWKGRIPFAEQLQLITDWHIQYKPILIGVEQVAYQTALIQQAARLPNLPPVVGQPAKGKKWERILTMGPLFRVGKVRVRDIHLDFIDEWINYDTTLKNPHDDCLDAVEIALRTAGALFPVASGPDYSTFDDAHFIPRGVSLADIIKADLPGNHREKDTDEMLGAEW